MSSPQFEIHQATRVHATQLAPKLRDSDVLEVKRANGMEPLPALLESLEVSDPDMCWTAMLDRHPVAMFGANELRHDIGGVWLLASPGIYRNKKDFHRLSVVFVDLMHERYKYLTNFVDEEHYVSRRWLQALGFVPVQKTTKYAVSRRPFIQYISER